jgi:hypothetical protein
MLIFLNNKLLFFFALGLKFESGRNWKKDPRNQFWVDRLLQLTFLLRNDKFGYNYHGYNECTIIKIKFNGLIEFVIADFDSMLSIIMT